MRREECAHVTGFDGYSVQDGDDVTELLYGPGEVAPFAEVAYACFDEGPRGKGGLEAGKGDATLDVEVLGTAWGSIVILVVFAIVFALLTGLLCADKEMFLRSERMTGAL